MGLIPVTSDLMRISLGPGRGSSIVSTTSNGPPALATITPFIVVGEVGPGSNQ